MIKLIKQLTPTLLLFFVVTTVAAELNSVAKQPGLSADSIVDITNGWASYNRGNKLFREQNFGAALAYYQLSASLLPGSTAVRTNLSLARSKLEPSPPPPTPAQEFISRTLPERITKSQLLWIILISNLAFWGLLGLEQASFVRRRLVKYVFGAVAAYSIAAVWISRPRLPEESLLSPDIFFKPLAITLNGGTPLYATPDEDSQIVRSLPAGFEARAEASRDNWHRLSLSDGRFGWLKPGSSLIVNPL